MEIDEDDRAEGLARAQLQLVAWFVILPLLMPVILVALEGLVPEGVIAVLNWIPTVLVAKVKEIVGDVPGLDGAVAPAA